MVFVNVPVQTGNVQEQYVMNAITKSWGQFQGWDANCWALFKDDIYFGSNTYVGKAWNTNQDDGVAIPSNGLQAFNYFGSPGTLKHFKMMRPTFLTNGSPDIQGAIAIDFNTATPTAALATTTPPLGAVWDSAVWDTALWGADLSVSNPWQGAAGVGYAGAPRLIAETDGMQLQWVSTDIVVEPGAIL
jgi:hypothetical protein